MIVSQQQDEGIVFRVYRRRWFVIFVAALLNFTNATIWISFTPIANYVNAFYCPTEFEECSSIASDVLAAIFMVMSIPFGFAALWSIDRFGLMTGMVFGAIFNGIGPIIRIISSLPGIPDAGEDNYVRLVLVVVGQLVAAVSQPFIMYLPTKTAATWFPDDERAVANTLGSMANPLGIMVAMLVSPQIVTKKDNMIWMLVVYGAGAVVALGLTLICACFCRKPPHAPSASASQESPPVWTGFKMALKNKNFVILAICLGSGVACFSTLYTYIQQLLCTKGYSNKFAGLCGAMLIVGGLVGSAISGFIVDKTKMFEEVSKICFGIAALFACFMPLVLLRPNLQGAILALFILFGFFGFAVYPIGLELGVELTFPVAEATSSGIIIITSQVVGIILVVLMTEGVLSKKLPLDSSDWFRETCSLDSASNVQPIDMSVSILVLLAYVIVMALVYIIFIRVQYRRLAWERARATKGASRRSSHNSYGAVPGYGGQLPNVIGPVRQIPRNANGTVAEMSSPVHSTDRSSATEISNIPSGHDNEAYVEAL